MKKIPVLIVSFCLLVSVPLLFSGDAPQKAEKKNIGEKVSGITEMLKGFQGAGKWISDLVNKLKLKPDAKKDKKKTKKKADKPAAKSKAAKKAETSAEKIKKAVEKAGRKVSQ